MVKDEQARQFLKERKLTRSFTEFKKLKGFKKRNIEVVFNNFDGTSTRKKIIVVRKNDVTQFRDFRTLQILGRSRRTTFKAISSLRQSPAIKRLKLKPFSLSNDGKKKFRDWNIQNNVKRSSINLKHQVKESTFNNTLQRLRTRVTSNNPQSGKFGHVVVNVTLIAADGIKKRVEARSFGGVNLSDRKQRDMALNNAINNSAAVAGFTPIEIIINNFWFEYLIERRTKLIRVT